jgi:DNA modification methylase
LLGIPWRVAFALQADGWYLRSDIIWHKPNPMPESVRDRPTKSHEYLFLLSKSQRYYYDQETVREVYTKPLDRWGGENLVANGTSIYDEGTGQQRYRDRDMRPNKNGRNRRTVWTIPTSPYSGAHFATFPPALVEPCILAGTSERGCCPNCGKPWERVVEHSNMVIDRSERTHEKGRTRSSGTMVEPAKTETIAWRAACSCLPAEPVPCTVLDPFAGTFTVGMVAAKHRRNAVGIELKREYIELARKRCSEIQVVML